VAVRSPQLHLALRSFCLGSFVFLGRALEEGDELPFSFEEHVQRDGPALYEYRPLVRSFVEARASALARREDARIALDELAREPAAAIYARAHAGRRPTEEQALFRTVLLALLLSTAEACGGFDWDDPAFEKAYAELERSLFGASRAYAAVAPLVGISVVTQVELGAGLRIRAAATGELARHWPEAQGLLPPGFGEEVDRYCVLELERELEAAEGPPDAPAELADAVTAIRLATAAPVSAGPVLFERLDWRPFGIRPVLPIAATQPPGEATRLDSFRAEVAQAVLARLGLADADGPLAEALDRWELALFQHEPFRSEQLRGAFAALLGETWELRAAVLLGESSDERRALHASLRALGSGEPVRPSAADAVRRALVAVLRDGDRPALLRALDDELLGLRHVHEQRATAV
jgi:phosphoglycolate phosphatase-like HAD superfamily hydrolase